jgi:hypothetical protein
MLLLTTAALAQLDQHRHMNLGRLMRRSADPARVALGTGRGQLVVRRRRC